MTVSQAVVQIGMRPLAELCSGLVLLQKFVPAARKDGSFAKCLKKTITTSLLTRALSEQLEELATRQKQETGYLAGTFFELGCLLLAFYFPQLYHNAEKRAEVKGEALGKAIQELCGLSPVELSLEVVRALKLPAFYEEVILASLNKESSENKIAKNLSNRLVAAEEISSVIVLEEDPEKLSRVLAKHAKELGLKMENMTEMIETLNNSFRDQCSILEIKLTPLPSFVGASFTEDAKQAALSKKSVETTKPKEADIPDTSDLQHFIDEIKSAVEAGEPTASVITTVMETIAWALNFDRVILLLRTQDRLKLGGRMALGKTSGIDPTQIIRPLNKEGIGEAPDIEAFTNGYPVYHGDPVLDDGWPIVALPIGFGKRALGVIYADRLEEGSSSDAEISSKEQAALGMLADLLDRSISGD